MRPRRSVEYKRQHGKEKQKEWYLNNLEKVRKYRREWARKKRKSQITGDSKSNTQRGNAKWLLLEEEELRYQQEQAKKSLARGELMSY